MMLRCKACGGEYEPRQRDGMAYYHACPPLVVQTVTRDGREIDAPIPELLETDIATVQRGDQVLQIIRSALLPGDWELRRRDVPRPGARDERVRLDGQRRAAGMVSVGAGTEPVQVRA